MTETLAEMKVFHIDGDIEGKPLATGPFVMRSARDGTVLITAVRLEDHCSSRSACSTPVTRKVGRTPGRNERLRAVVSGIAKHRETLFDIGQGARD